MRLAGWAATGVLFGVVGITLGAGCDGADTGGSGGGGTGGSGGEMPVTTTATTTSSTGGGPACGDVLPTHYAGRSESCGACADENCCDEEATCPQGSPCGDYVACQDACPIEIDGLPNADCFDGCVAEFPDGRATFLAAQACVAASCPDACFNGYYPICDSRLDLGDPACASCFGGSCCDDVADCLQDDTCLQCINGGLSSEDCAASAAYAALSLCWNDTCGDVCGLVAGICESGLTTGDQACDQCMNASCCADFSACLADADCQSCMYGTASPGHVPGERALRRDGLLRGRQLCRHVRDAALLRRRALKDGPSSIFVPSSSCFETKRTRAFRMAPPR